MAAGDMVSSISSVNASSYLDISPGSGEHWVIHNIYHESKVELYWYDGSSVSICFDYHMGFDRYEWYSWHCKNTLTLRIKNIDSTAKWIKYDGIISDLTIKSAMSQISSGSSMEIRPTGTEEWVIHNIAHEDDVELYWSDGSTDYLFDGDFGLGGWQCYEWHVKNGHFIKVKNKASASKYIQYDGVLTRT